MLENGNDFDEGSTDSEEDYVLEENHSSDTETSNEELSDSEADEVAVAENQSSKQCIGKDTLCISPVYTK